jgi:hypothetical protein
MAAEPATDYVSLILGTEVRVARVTPERLRALQALPGDLARVRAHDGNVVLVAPDRNALGALLGCLRDLGIAFSYGPGWHPSAVFADLRDRGAVHGTYREIAWRGPGDWFITER